MDKNIDNIKYKIIDLKNEIDDKLTELKELNYKLSKIWLEIEKYNQ